MNQRRMRPTFPPFLILLIVFAAGVLVERSGWIPGRRGSEPAALRTTFAPFWEAWDLVQRYYVDRESVKDEPMMQGSLRGMIDSLGDIGHTSYLTKKQREELNEGLASQLEGIGGGINMLRQPNGWLRRFSHTASGFRWHVQRRRVPTIVQTMPRSPARAAGVQAGDVILAVDGQSVRGLTLGQIVARVRGKPGTVVRLRLARRDHRRPIEVAITRARVDVEDVTWQMIPGRTPIAHVSFQRFSKDSGKKLRKALEEARAQGAAGAILDLRGNQGGLKEQAVAVASEFLAKDAVVFIEQDAQGKQDKILAAGGGVWEDRPLAVLINGGSASSSEIVAGALQDSGRAKLVGTRTVGTGTVLRPFELSDGSTVLLAVSLWLTPDGRQIWHKGIVPDEVVPLPTGARVLLPDDQVPLTAERFARSDDLPLRRAYEMLPKQRR
jgi:carboxyl-terminal processing protease